MALKSGIIHIANLLCKNQQYDEAQAMLSGLLQLHNHLPARIKQVEILLSKQQYKTALQQVNMLIEENKFNVRLLNLKTEICIEAERWPDAEQAIQRALQLHNSSVEQTLNIAWLHIASNHFEKAIPHLLHVANLLPHSMWDTSGQRGLSIYADMCNTDKNALQNWRADVAWYRISRGNDSNLTSKATQKALQALRLAQLGNTELATDLLDQILDKEIADFETGFLICLGYRDLGRNEELSQIKLQIDPSNGPTTTSSLSRLQSLALKDLVKIDTPSLTVTG